MKRPLYILPLMTFTALSLTLAACDDKKKAEEAPAPVEQSAVASETDATPQEEPLAMPPQDAPVVESMPAANAPIIMMSASNPRAYATAEGAQTGAVFVTLQNSQDNADKLTGAKTDKAETVEIHESFVDPDTGTMKMRKVDSIEIPAGGTLELKPGGYHIMLMGLKEPLVAGQSLDLTLTFESAQEIKAPVSIVSPVEASGATGPSSSTHDHDSHAHEAPEAPAAQEPVTHEQPAE